MRFSMPFTNKQEGRAEACRLALAEGANRRQLCRRFGVSQTTLYKWMERLASEGEAGLRERSRRPHRSPRRTPGEIEAAVLGVRRENPVWGGRKIAASLRRQGQSPPSPSTITAILRRHGVALVAPGQRAWKRFEHAEPNVLWQMDFKGDVPFGGGRLHPLTAVDDHSRYSVILQATDNQRRQSVQSAVQAAFERYGLPEIMLTDNGNPWGDDSEHGLTKFGVWLIEHGVAPWHSAPRHPQSHGKNERFNRTLKAELLEGRSFGDLHEAQHAFDAWRQRYNYHRPHDALDLAVPADRYRPSSRSFSSIVEPFDYGTEVIMRRVYDDGRIFFQKKRLRASRALAGKDVALRPTDDDGIFTLVFRHVTVRSIDLRSIS